MLIGTREFFNNSIIKITILIVDYLVTVPKVLKCRNYYSYNKV
ncbi:hypothetical protein LEP1GSC115_1258 [Leptospira interrogans serovar Australis str. 200703203]|uniref:Uncharacterized protein n=1 Tax=Leptospira interrogans serovar Australis str. 200703203 TaxID=1085541 RepID=N1URK8_LEPIR|nr:hypothetical protein LEP1GSC115_1258 [Leptospira interrogans serovar Australis str. 200703203]